MDTTTVNFAINKMTEAWGKVAPSVENFTEEYVSFVVYKAVLAQYMWGTLSGLMLLAIIGFGLFMVVFDKRKPSSEAIGFPIMSGMFCFILFIFSAAFGAQAVYTAHLAQKYPEMYTIQKVVNQ